MEVYANIRSDVTFIDVSFTYFLSISFSFKMKRFILFFFFLTGMVFRGSSVIQREVQIKRKKEKEGKPGSLMCRSLGERHACFFFFCVCVCFPGRLHSAPTVPLIQKGKHIIALKTSLGL